VAVLMATIAGAFLLVDQLPALVVILVPPAIERVWSTSIETTISIGSRRCEAPAGRAVLTSMVGTLAAAAGLSLPPHFVVLDSGVVNAFTLPDGRIVIMRGLIAKAGDGDEFAGVMAHELGHVLHHDPTREMIRGWEISLLASPLGGGGSIVSQMTALSYDRHAEAAADASALETLRRAGWATDGLGHFLARIQGGPGGTDLSAFLSDHPSTAARIAALNVVSVGKPAMTADDWASIQTICSAATPSGL
jgi:predicted Zn-dependent protease